MKNPIETIEQAEATIRTAESFIRGVRLADFHAETRAQVAEDAALRALSQAETHAAFLRDEADRARRFAAAGLTYTNSLGVKCGCGGACPESR